MEFWLPGNGAVDFQAQVLSSSSSSIHLGFHVLHCLWHLTNMVRFCFLINPPSFWKNKNKICLVFWGPCNDPRVVDFWMACLLFASVLNLKRKQLLCSQISFPWKHPAPTPITSPLVLLRYYFECFPSIWRLVKRRIHFVRFQKCYSNRSFAAFWSWVFVVGER